MGSSKPSNQDDMPFGYSFDGSNPGYPFPSPPAPAPGPSLLDDNESRFLDSFFDGVSSDQFSADFFSTLGDGPDMGFGWQDIPPNFMGTTSSFGQQPTSSGNDLQHMVYSHRNGNMDGTTNGIPSTTSPDVLAAAALLQNGHSNRTFSIGHEALFPTQALSTSMDTHSIINATMPYESSQPGKLDYMRDTSLSDLIFGTSTSTRQSKVPAKPVEIRWGSDAGFGGNQGFTAPMGQETMETLEQNRTHVLECLEPRGSTAASTRQNSPVITRQNDAHRLTSEKAFFQEDDEEDEDEDGSRPRKRRKSKMLKEEDDIDGDGLNKAMKKRRPKITNVVTDPSSSNTTQSPPPSKRRKSTTSSAVKPSRENLTEHQKRENHIKSEQKRRTLIKEGFDDLGELVPALRGGGFSKSAVLVMAADWLEDLIKGNNVLRAQLDDLQVSQG